MATATRSYKINKSSGGNFTPMSEGLHAAVVAEVKDLGDIQGQFGVQHKFVARFVNAAGEEASRFYTPSIHEKSNLYKDWNKVIDLNVEEFDIYSLEGQQCQVLATERVNGKGQTTADVSKILKPVAGQNIVVAKKSAAAPPPAVAAKKAPAKSAAKPKATPKPEASDEITDADIPF